MTQLARGLTSVGIANIVEKLLGIAKLVIVSRILGPSEFGLFGLALVVILTVEQFTQVGFESALIAKREIHPEDKSSAWLLLLARGLVLAAIIWLCAPLFASFFGEPSIRELVQVMVIGVVITAFQSVEVFIARREMRFGPWLWIRVTGSATDLVVSVALAVAWGTAMGLVVGYVASALTRTVVGYVTAPYRPRWLLTRASLAHLIRFGRWATGLSIVLFVLTQGDDLVVAKLLGVGALGLYQMGYRISNMPTSEVTHVFSSFTLPLYARMKNAGESVSDAYRTILAVTAMIALPVAVMIVAFAHPFVTVFLGDDWLPAVPIIQLLAVWGVTRSLDATAGSLFFALGRPDLDFKLHLAKVILLAAMIFPAARLSGLTGVAAAVVTTGLVMSPITMRASAGLLMRPAVDLWRALLMPFGLAGGTAAVSLAILNAGLSDGIGLALGTLFAACLAGAVALAGWRGSLPVATAFFRLMGVRT